MSTTYLRGFYPRIVLHDELVYVQHGVQSAEALKVLEVTEVNLRKFYPKTFPREKPVLAQRKVAEEVESGFTTLNLRFLYRNAILEKESELVIVKNAIADELLTDVQYQNANACASRRQNVLSYDARDGTLEKASAAIKTNRPEILIEFLEQRCLLCHALNTLPEIQGRRVEAHYVLRMSRKEIACKESVSKSALNKSIKKGLGSMKKYLINFYSGGCQTAFFGTDR